MNDKLVLEVYHIETHKTGTKSGTPMRIGFAQVDISSLALSDDSLQISGYYHVMKDIEGNELIKYDMEKTMQNSLGQIKFTISANQSLKKAASTRPMHSEMSPLKASLRTSNCLDDVKKSYAFL
jgi:hypothetical protein